MRVAALALLLLSASGSFAMAQKGKPPQPLSGQCGGDTDPPCPGAAIIATSYVDATNPPEAGPFTYTITVQNVSNTTGTISVACVALAAQLPCIAPTPASFTIPRGATRVVTVGYTTKGMGRFNQEYRAAWVSPEEITRSGDTLVVGVMTVFGAGIAAHLNPPDSGDFPFGDTLRAVFDHASGVTTGSIRLLIDGGDSTNNNKVTINGTTLTASGLQLTTGFRSFGTYVCAVNGRCDTLRTTVNAGPAPVYSLDDSLPITDGLGLISGLLPGALPLPLDTLRGCPVHIDDPEIRLGEPTSFVSQPANATTPAGYIFRAMMVVDTVIRVNTLNHDFTPADNKTCANYTYLQDNQYDWNFWMDTDPDDPLWDVYPYGDRSQGFGGGGQSIALIPELSSSMTTAAAAGAQRGKPKPPDGEVTPMVGSAGAINPSTFMLWLNGTLIVNNNTPIGSQVRHISSSKVGATYEVSGNHPSLNTHNPLNPPSDSGGWNEMIASIADSTGHRSYVRARFVNLGSGPASIAPVPVTPVRDFSHVDQGECAAFGALQCGGIMLTQSIPGFVTRDRDRSLHLVYRSNSQRAPTILPYEITIGRIQLAPESLQVTLREGGALVGWNGQLNHYFGTVLPSPAGPFDVSQVLNELVTTQRVVGTDLPASSQNAAIRSIKASVRPFYNGAPAPEDTVRQEVVQLYLTDTTTTRFGAGWALAEQSRLIFGLMYQGDAAAIWLSGDGSYTIFRKPGSVWITPAGETSRLVETGFGHQDSAAYIVYLWNGASVGFRSNGWQLYTADLLGNRTRFVYPPNNLTRLDSIVDPAGHAFAFRYDSSSAPGLVSDIWLRAPGGATSRVATLRFDASRRLTVFKTWVSSTKADSSVFGYHATAPGAFVTSVTDPRSSPAKPIVTTFTYDPLYYTPETIVRPPDHVGVATSYYRDPLRRLLPRVGYGRVREQIVERVERLVATDQARGTFIGAFARPVDFTVDRFGGPTSVRHFAPPGYMTPEFLVEDYGGDDVRIITRDTLGRVTAIVHGNPVYYDQASVIYEYDAASRVVRIIKTTAEFPITSSTLDTVTFVHDSVASATYRCSRLLTMTDPMGGVTTTVYGAANESRCLPIKTIGLAQDTTIFSYTTLVKGNPVGVRPTSVRDPNGLTLSMQYDAVTWNSSVSTRAADGATSRAFYNPFGRPDSLLDAMNARTFFRYDQSGRVIRTKTGTGPSAPTTWTFFAPGGLVDSVRVYGSNDGFEAGADSVAVTDSQTTRSFYNRLGWVDSTKTSGGRRVRYTRDRLGQPIIENTGIGSYLSRSWDWQGRLLAEYQSQVGPFYSSNGDDFAEARAESTYASYNLSWPNTLSSGQVHKFDYDNRGRRTLSWTRDYGLGGEWLVDRTFIYNRPGAVVGETLRFADGATVTRTYQYNRRGQRTVAATVVSGVTVSEPRDTMRYVYNDAVARLDSLTSKAYTTSGSPIDIGRVKWVYDRGGRDTLQSVRLGGATAGELQTRSGYDAAGRLSLLEGKTVGGNTWYAFGNANYNLGDNLLDYSAAERKPGAFETWNHSATYATNGTGRLATAGKALGTHVATFSYDYDVFGNRLADQSQYTYVGAGDGCQTPFTSTFGSDNQLETRRVSVGCSRAEMYWNDRAGNRLVQLDTTNGSYSGPKAIMSYTAKNQLFFSMSPTVVVGGNKDYNWHWYDATGIRVITQVGSGTGWVPTMNPATLTTPRTYYVYDGNDVALVLVRSGGSWMVRQRYLTGGLDDQVAGRFNYTGTPRNLALVRTRDGTTLTAVKTDGTQETESWYYSRDPFGEIDQLVGTSGTISSETGFTGASTPNSTGGFVYLRNRWYDPQTGRFLTQDPIGLAGGVNLYAYAGNDPVNYSDPFGLWPDYTSGIQLIGALWNLVGAINDMLPRKLKDPVGILEHPSTVTDPSTVAQHTSDEAVETLNRAANRSRTIRVPQNATGAVRHLKVPPIVRQITTKGGKFLGPVGVVVGLMTIPAKASAQQCRVERCDASTEIVNAPNEKPKSENPEPEL